MRTDHPDRDWITRTITSLEGWLDAPAATPTSQLTGGGAVAVAERLLSRMHADRPTLLVPSATFGILSVLATLGVGPGTEVLIPTLDWPATLAAVRTLGATPVPVPVAGDTWTIDPHAAAQRRTPRTRAVVACHLLGVPADIPALRLALPHLAIIEDCAQAFGSTLDGRPVGTLGDAAVFSFGPGKEPIDVGEAGAVITRDTDLNDELLRYSAHPIRQQHGGVSNVDPAPLNVRAHPLAAVLLAVALDTAASGSVIALHRQLAADLEHRTGLRAIGDDPRRGIATRTVAVDAKYLRRGSRPSGFHVHESDVLDIASITETRPRAGRRIACFGPQP